MALPLPFTLMDGELWTGLGMEQSSGSLPSLLPRNREYLKILTTWRLAGFRMGSVTVAGDAMHVMGPFNGQGGSTALGDDFVLARSLSSLAGRAAGTRGVDDGWTRAARGDHRNDWEARPEEEAKGW
ncbi:hypothetical protein C2845_PM17G10590 [Panicum miliaceum]|uniref:FAD-binding domain-containing protein n=1 Tax=Panicum miliaceum TaxID=4540 RepID=A0A3L6Q0Q1_PANMI|nr:hypothetical protein C2845_PM17G10590 [Panicum miliaceum]